MPPSLRWILYTNAIHWLAKRSPIVEQVRVTAESTQHGLYTTAANPWDYQRRLVTGPLAFATSSQWKKEDRDFLSAGMARWSTTGDQNWPQTWSYPLALLIGSFDASYWVEEFSNLLENDAKKRMFWSAALYAPAYWANDEDFWTMQSQPDADLHKSMRDASVRALQQLTYDEASGGSIATTTGNVPEIFGLIDAVWKKGRSNADTSLSVDDAIKKISLMSPPWEFPDGTPDYASSVYEELLTDLHRLALARLYRTRGIRAHYHAGFSLSPGPSSYKDHPRVSDALSNLWISQSFYLPSLGSVESSDSTFTSFASTLRVTSSNTFDGASVKLTPSPLALARDHRGEILLPQYLIRQHAAVNNHLALLDAGYDPISRSDALYNIGNWEDASTYIHRLAGVLNNSIGADEIKSVLQGELKAATSSFEGFDKRVQAQALKVAETENELLQAFNLLDAARTQVAVYKAEAIGAHFAQESARLAAEASRYEAGAALVSWNQQAYKVFRQYAESLLMLQTLPDYDIEIRNALNQIAFTEPLLNEYAEMIRIKRQEYLDGKGKSVGDFLKSIVAPLANIASIALGLPPLGTLIVQGADTLMAASEGRWNEAFNGAMKIASATGADKAISEWAGEQYEELKNDLDLDVGWIESLAGDVKGLAPLATFKAFSKRNLPPKISGLISSELDRQAGELSSLGRRTVVEASRTTAARVLGANDFTNALAATAENGKLGQPESPWDVISLAIRSNVYSEVSGLLSTDKVIKKEEDRAKIKKVIDDSFTNSLQYVESQQLKEVLLKFTDNYSQEDAKSVLNIIKGNIDTNALRTIQLVNLKAIVQGKQPINGDFMESLALELFSGLIHDKTKNAASAEEIDSSWRELQTVLYSVSAVLDVTVAKVMETQFKLKEEGSVIAVLLDWHRELDERLMDLAGQSDHAAVSAQSISDYFRYIKETYQQTSLSQLLDDNTLRALRSPPPITMPHEGRTQLEEFERLVRDARKMVQQLYKNHSALVDHIEKIARAENDAAFQEAQTAFLADVTNPIKDAQIKLAQALDQHLGHPRADMTDVEEAIRNESAYEYNKLLRIIKDELENHYAGEIEKHQNTILNLRAKGLSENSTVVSASNPLLQEKAYIKQLEKERNKKLESLPADQPLNITTAQIREKLAELSGDQLPEDIDDGKALYKAWSREVYNKTFPYLSQSAKQKPTEIEDIRRRFNVLMDSMQGEPSRLFAIYSSVKDIWGSECDAAIADLKQRAETSKSFSSGMSACESAALKEARDLDVQRASNLLAVASIAVTQVMIRVDRERTLLESAEYDLRTSAALRDIAAVRHWAADRRGWGEISEEEVRLANQMLWRILKDASFVDKYYGAGNVVETKCAQYIKDLDEIGLIDEPRWKPNILTTLVSSINIAGPLSSLLERRSEVDSRSYQTITISNLARYGYAVDDATTLNPDMNGSWWAVPFKILPPGREEYSFLSPSNLNASVEEIVLRAKGCHVKVMDRHPVMGRSSLLGWGASWDLDTQLIGDLNYGDLSGVSIVHLGDGIIASRQSANPTIYVELTWERRLSGAAMFTPGPKPNWMTGGNDSFDDKVRSDIARQKTEKSISILRLYPTCGSYLIIFPRSFVMHPKIKSLNVYLWHQRISDI